VLDLRHCGDESCALPGAEGLEDAQGEVV